MPATSAVDRAEWAAVLEELLAVEVHGNVAEMARRLRVDASTVRRWLAGDVYVSADVVHHVAVTFSVPLGPLLVRVGWLQPADLRPPAETAAGDAAAAVLAGADVPPSVRRDLEAYIARRRALSDKQLAADLDRIVAAEQRAHRAGRAGPRGKDSPTR